VPRVSLKAEPTERATADDVATSVAESLRDVSFCTRRVRDLGAGTGVPADGFDLRRKCIAMVNVQVNDGCCLQFDSRLIGNVITRRSALRRLDG